MKKFLLIAALVFATTAVYAQQTIKVGATPEPHAEILNLIKDDLAAKGVKLEVVEFTDYVTPNDAVEAGDIDANYFQHIPYLDSFNKEKGYHLVNAGGIHVEPFALYSKKVTKLDQFKNKAVIAIPNDPTNEGRALLLLADAGLITLKADAGITAEAASLPRVLGDVDGAVINGNYAIPAGLSANKDGLFVEGSSSPYVNVIAVKAGNENKPAIKALVEALKTQKVKDYIAKRYPNGEVVPVF